MEKQKSYLIKINVDNELFKTCTRQIYKCTYIHYIYTAEHERDRSGYVNCVTREREIFLLIAQFVKPSEK